MSYHHYLSSLARDLQSKWKESSVLKKRILACQFILIVDLLLCLFVFAVYDQTRLLVHLFVLSIICLILAITHRLLVRKLLEKLNIAEDSRRKVIPHYIIIAVVAVSNLIPFPALIKFCINMNWLFSVFSIWRVVFRDAFDGTFLFVAQIAAIGGWLAEAVHLVLFLTISTVILSSFVSINITRHEKLFTMIGEPEKKEPSLKRKVLSSTLLSICSGLFISCLTYASLLCADGFWLDSVEVSKYDAIKTFTPHVNMNSYVARKVSDLDRYKLGLSKPLVIKPNVCTIGSKNVQICRDYRCLKDYVQDFLEIYPSEKRPELSWLIQDYCPKQEAAIFYYRYPYFNHGSILNVGVRSPAKKSKYEELRHRYHPDEYIEASPKLVGFFDDLTREIPCFTGGIIDVMMEGLEQAQLDGSGIQVMEVNVFPLTNISENPTKDMSFWEGLKRSLLTNRTILMQVWFGAYNILSGNIKFPWKILLRLYPLYKRFRLCGCEVRHFLAQP